MTPEREQLIRDMANDEWTARVPRGMSDADFDNLAQEWEKRTAEFVRTTTDPAELHLFSQEWNWDGGFEVLRDVIENKHCDKATALMIYWRGQPPYFSRFQNQAKTPDDNQDAFEFLMMIQNRFIRDEFPVSLLVYYDPYMDDDSLHRIKSHPNHDWIPRAMFDPVGQR